PAELAAEERELLKRLAELPGIAAEAAERRGPHAIPYYAIRVADDFHRFYHHHRVLESDAQAFRLGLCRATQAVIARCLDLIGVESLRQARRTAAAVSGAAAKKSGNAYLQGLISTVLNPKPALFFLSYLPQFIDRRGSVVLQVALLAAIHIVVGLVWLTFYAWFVSRLHAALIRPRVMMLLERVASAVLIAVV